MIWDIHQAVVTFLQGKSSVFTEAGLYIPAHYDMFNGQYLPELVDENNPFNKPAIFTEFEWSMIDKLRWVQDVTVNMRIHVVQESVAESADFMGEKTQVQMMMDFVDTVHLCLHQQHLPGYSRMQRRRIVPETSNTNLWVYIIEYEMVFIDASTDENGNLVMTDGNGNVSITPQLVQQLPGFTPIASPYSV